MSLNEKNLYSIFKILWSKKRRNEMVKIFIGEANFTYELWNEFFQLIRNEDGFFKNFTYSRFKSFNKMDQ